MLYIVYEHINVYYYVRIESEKHGILPLFHAFYICFCNAYAYEHKKTMPFEFQLKLKRLKPIIMVIDFRYKCRNE